MSLSRRDVLRLAAAAAAAPLVPRATLARAVAAAVPAVAAGRFFTASEMALLDELTEAIIPADEHSGGARAARVAAAIDGRLAEYDASIPDLREERESWRAGLAVVDAAARASWGTGFLAGTPEQKRALLERLAEPAAEGPDAAGRRFFAELKSGTASAYYTSKVGIHDEMEYKGNTLLVEFSGTDPATLPPVRPTDD